MADCSYDLTPEKLCEKIKNVDALIVRSATKVTKPLCLPKASRWQQQAFKHHPHSCIKSYLVIQLQVTRAVFEASQGRLKVVGRAGVGIDNVDLQAATEV